MMKMTNSLILILMSVILLCMILDKTFDFEEFIWLGNGIILTSHWLKRKLIPLLLIRPNSFMTILSRSRRGKGAE